MAKNKNPFKPKGTLFTYENWAPSDVNPFYTKEYAQEDLINEYKKIYSQTDLPIILSRMAESFPQNPDIALSLAKSGANGDAVSAAARMQTFLNESKTNVLANKPYEGADAQMNNIDYVEYLKALNKDAETAAPQDEDDAAWFAGVKRSSRTFLTPLITGYDLATNTIRQIDGYVNRNENPANGFTDPDNVIIGGEDAADFTRIYKNTLGYQNINEGLGVGTGFIPTGEAYATKEALSSRVARVRSAKTGQEYFYTPGRGIVSSLTTLDPEDNAYKVLSGILDFWLGFKIDPTILTGKAVALRSQKIATNNLNEATSAGRSASATLADATKEATARANLPARESVDALAKQKIAAQELDEVFAKIAEQRNALNTAITEGAIAQQPASVQAAIKRAGLQELNDSRVSLLGKIQEQKLSKVGMVLDPATGAPKSMTASMKYLKDELKSVNAKINAGLDDVYITRSKKVRDVLALKQAALQQATDNLAEASKKLQEVGTPAAKQRFIEQERAGLLETADGFKVNKETAITWFAGKNADVVLERIAELNSAAAIIQLSKGKFNANLAKELAGAKTVDDVEKILLGNIGVTVDTLMPRSALGRYRVNTNPNFIMKSKSSVQNLNKYNQALRFLGTIMPKQISIKLDDTDELVKNVYRWMVAVRWNTDDINKVLDDIIAIDELDFVARARVVTGMLDNTVVKYVKEQKLNPKIESKLTQFTTAYESAASGFKRFTSAKIGDEVGSWMMINGKNEDLTQLPTSTTQLATEISLPNVYHVRELTGIMARVYKSVDNVVSKDARRAERAGFAAARFTRWVTDGPARSVLLVGRVAYGIRNIAEMQVRMYLAGGIGMFTNPVAFTALIMSNPQSAKALVKRVAAKDPYSVDINGKAFMGAERAMANDTQVFHNDFSNTMASRGAAMDGQNMRAAMRSGQYETIKLDLTQTGSPRNGAQYSEALASRLLQHYADPIKRIVAVQNIDSLPGTLSRAVNEGRMTYEEAVIQAIRDGAFKRQIDLLGNAVPVLKKLLGTDAGMRTLLFGNTSRSYAREITDETLGITQLRELIATGKITKKTEKVVDGVTTIVEKVIFEVGPNHLKNSKKLANIIENELQKSEIARTNASNLFIPSEIKASRLNDPISYAKFAAWFFATASRAEVRTVYGPEYRIAYWEAAAEMAPLMSRKAAAKVLKDAEDIKRTRVATEGADGEVVYQRWTELNPAFDDIVTASKEGVGTLTARDIDDYARDKASKRIANLYYDATKKNNFTYAAQLVLPFVGAWANTIKKWGQLGTNPTRLATRVYPAVKVYENAQSENSSVVYDFTGTPHDPMQGFIWEDKFGDKVFTIPLSGNLRTLFGLAGNPDTADISIPLKSLNLAFSGAELADSDIGILPGVGTVWNIFYSALDNDIQRKVPNFLTEMIAPYGTSEGNYLTGLPSWIQKIAGGLKGDTNAYGKTAKPIMAWEATTNPKYKALYDGTPLSPEERAILQSDLVSYGLSRARYAYIMQGLIQNVSPGTPVYQYYANNENDETFMQWQMADSLNKIMIQHDGNYETAWAEYTAVWGRAAVLTGFGENKDSIFANDEAWQFAKSNPETFAVYGDVIPYFFTGGDFSTDYKKAMERRGKGDRLTPQEILQEADRLSISALRGQLAIEAVYGGYDAAWIDEQMKNYKANVLQGYVPEQTITVGGRDQKIMRIESAIKKPEFAATDAGKAAILYFAERDRWLLQSSLYYPDRETQSLSGKDNAEARYRLRILSEQLSVNNDDFKNMFIRVLAQELKEEG